MKIKLADGLPFHPTLRHPRTGDRLRAIGILNGKPVWPVMGASEDDDNGEGGEGGKSEEDGDNDSDKGKETEKLTPEQRRIAELEEELKKVRVHRSEADKKKSAAEKELEKLKNAELSEVDRLKKELEAEKSGHVKASEGFKSMALTNAFLKASQRAKIQWHDPDVAQAAADLKSLEIEEDGQVSGMEELVKKLAKDKAFLVDKGKNVSKDDEEEEKPKKGPSGNGVGSGKAGGKGTKTGATEEELRKRFPALYK